MSWEIPGLPDLCQIPVKTPEVKYLFGSLLAVAPGYSLSPPGLWDFPVIPEFQVSFTITCKTATVPRLGFIPLSHPGAMGLAFEPDVFDEINVSGRIYLGIIAFLMSFLLSQHYRPNGALGCVLRHGKDSANGPCTPGPKSPKKDSNKDAASGGYNPQLSGTSSPGRPCALPSCHSMSPGQEKPILFFATLFFSLSFLHTFCIPGIVFLFFF